MDLTRLTVDELLEIAASIPQRTGWDFSYVRDARDPVPWDYSALVRQFLHPTDRVLDCGTGGGERFLALSNAYAQGIGLDPDPAMLAAARENAARAVVAHVAWVRAVGEELPLANASVDAVLNRHANAGVGEVLRVLRPGGYYITQGVGRRNLAAVCGAFGCGVGGEYAWDPEETVYRIADVFHAAGGEIRTVAEYDVPYTLLDVPSLLYLLQGVGIPEDLDLARDADCLIEIIRGCATPEGIRLNEHRELLIVQKKGH